MLASTDSLVGRIRVKHIGLVAALIGSAAVAAVALTHQSAGAPTPQPVPVAEAAGAPAPASTVLVFVSGAVAHPGLYRVSTAARVADAIAAAGGITALADPGHLPNLSALVHDGHQINVPIGKGSAAVAAKLDINSATTDELAGLPGMAAGLPEEIVQFRGQWGAFTTLSQLSLIHI